ncbi:MAG: hypothetical protein BGO78_11340 [Chloroflexi bacterium 44-23]|nr:MAG: hypothetical protein BGO78_11340 [Chloroflexi bacterium 44-23]
MSFFRKFTALFVIGISILGILFSLFCLVQVWRLRVPVTNGFIHVLNLSDGILATSEDGLEIVDNVLVTADSSLTKLKDTTDTIAKSIEDTGRLADTFAGLFHTDLKDTLLNTRLSVIAARSSAKVIDSLLYGLSQIPYSPFQYNPKVPLNLALEDIADSMEALPASLENISTNLDNSSSNLVTLKDQVSSISSSLDEIQISLVSARVVISNSQDKIDELQSMSARLRKNLNVIMWTASILLSIFLLSIAMAQIGAASPALDVLRGKRSS